MRACKLDLWPAAAKRDDQGEQDKQGSRCAEHRRFTSVAKIVAATLAAYLWSVVSSVQQKVEKGH